MDTGAETRWEVSFPPLLRGEEAPRGQDPFAKAVSAAMVGTDAGLVVWSRDRARLDAALVLAPEEPLARAATVTFAVALGLGDALGALAPPEVAVHYVWPGGIKVNGANCGRLRAAASANDPATVPDWLVVGVTVPYLPDDGAEPGETPDETALALEGCADVTPDLLLESWARHTLHWINRWMDGGLAAIEAQWRDRAWGIGEPLPDGATFMGLDEEGNQIVKTGKGTELRPLIGWLT